MKTRSGLSRRDFLQYMGVGTVGGVVGAAGGTAEAVLSAGSNERACSSAADGVFSLTEHLFVHRGPINVGIIRDGDKVLLIDCGDASVAEALTALGITSVDQILFTHHHRDQACGANLLAEKGARMGVPAAERDAFDKVATSWSDPKNRWHTYGFRPHHLMLAEPLRVDFVVKDGDVLTWGPARIRVLTTPGHTDGSVSYLIEVDGKKVVFSGDVIFDEGRLWDIHSLQKGFSHGGQQVGDYHGFLGARPQLVQSLKRLRAVGPEILIPSHGHIMSDPAKAIDALVQRMDECYDQYVAISALRYYFPKLFTDYAGRRGHMPFAATKPVPSCLRHFGTSWVLVSQDKAACVMDCGSADVVRRTRELIDRGEVRSIEGLWITHYHDDHVDFVPEFLEAFQCPCITDGAVAQVITDPLAWRLPCISPKKAQVDRVTRNGESWRWHEYKMTAYHLPGQTLYHSGLLVEGQRARMLFVGDSFTPAGIDDYCAQNRCWLGRDVGFDRCIALIEELKPTHLFNCHVDKAFAFTADECRFMRANLARREETFGRLVAWDHANYGTDDSWVRCYPYEQRVKAGGQARFEVIVTNHSAGERTLACRPVPPRAWNRPGGTSDVPYATCVVPSKRDGKVPIAFQVPAGTPAGRYVIPVDVTYGPRILPQFTEAIIVV